MPPATRRTSTRGQPTEDNGRAMRPSLPADLKPIADADFGHAQARHLLWRAGFGGTPAQIHGLAALGPERAVELLFDFGAAPYDRPLPDSVNPKFNADYTAAEQLAYRKALANGDENEAARIRAIRQQRQRTDRRAIRELQRWWVARMIESPAPLQEKLTLFWHGHFATSYRTVEHSAHMLRQNQLFRAHAAGNFGEMLFAIIRDPAMLRYLNNEQSRKDQPNENLARELMELFSLGEGNYSERDIKDGARALTGYTFNQDGFTFDRQNHDGGRKTILGAVGNLDGDAFVRAILNQRACAQFIATKLYRFFVQETASDRREQSAAVRGAIDDLAAEILRHRYDLRPALTTLFSSAHFYHHTVIGQQIKSPAALVAGIVRSMDTPVRDLGVLVDAMRLMGQDLFFPPSVKGWEGGRSWINTSTLFVRQNTSTFLLTGRRPSGSLDTGDTYDPMSLLAPLAEADPAAVRDPDRVVDYILRFTVSDAPEYARDAMRTFTREHGTRVTPSIVTGLLVLAASMPEYQAC